MVLYLLIPIILLLICFISGKGIKHLILKDVTLNSVVTGFVFLIALFYITAMPFMYTHGRADILFIIYLIEAVLILIYSIYVIVRKERYITQTIKPFFKKTFRDRAFLRDHITVILFIVIAALALIHILIMWFKCHTDIDDAFYIGMTNTIIKSGHINPYEPSTGIPELPFQMQYAMVGHEVMYALLCKIFRVNAALMYHSIMPGFLVVIHYLMIYETVKLIDKEKRYAGVMTLFAALINYFSNYSVYSSGAFAMTRMWQGKAVLVNVILPFVLYVFVRIFNNKKITYQDNILIFVSIICGMYASVVGLYIIPLACALYGVSYLISIRDGVQFKNWFKILIPAALSVPPALMIYRVLSTGADMVHLTGDADKIVYTDILMNIKGNGFIVFIFAAAALYLMIFEKGLKRYLFGVYSIVCFITVLNPYISGFMAKYVTGTEVYWRLFWLLQMNICIEVCMGSIIKRADKNRIIYSLATAAGCILIIFAGKFMLTEGTYEIAQTPEKITAEEKEMSDAILSYAADNGDEDIRFLIPETYSYGVRQYTGDIKLVWSRYSEDVYRQQNRYDDLGKLTYILYNSNSWDDNIINLLKEYNVNYVALYKSFNNIADNDHFSDVVYEGSEIVVVRFDKEKST